MTRTLTLAGYAVLAAGMLGVQAAGRVGARRLVTFGVVLLLLTGRRPAQLLLVAAWLWLGWHLFVRVDRG